MIKSVKRILERISLIFHAFLSVLNTLYHLARSAYCFDFFFCRGREDGSLYSYFLCDFTAAEYLNSIKCLFENTCFFESFSVYNSAVFKNAVDCFNIYNSIFFSEYVIETSFRKSSGKRDLTAFETGTNTAAGTSILTFVALARCFTVTGACASTFTEVFLCRTDCRSKFMKLYFGLSSLHCVFLYIDYTFSTLTR